MKFLNFTLLISIAFLSSCEDVLSDKQIKGILTVNKAQYGNKYLEVFDEESGLNRFIYPGKKIIELKPISSDYSKIIIMDSKRVPLAQFEVKNSDIQTLGEEHYFIKNSAMKNQAFDLEIIRKKILLRVEHLPYRGKECTLSKCSSNTAECQGSIGRVWKVEDTRYDYQIKFITVSSEKPYGLLQATGDRIIEDERFKTETCLPRIKEYVNKEYF